MPKNLTPKIVLIIVLVLLAAWTLFPPNKTLKPGIDLAGGTSLIFEIDTFDLTESEKENLSQRMITVLRRRIDPANIQNLVWRPQGNTRFEIQLPLASAEATEKLENYKKAENALLTKNVSRSKIMQTLKRPVQERSELFAEYAQSDPNKLDILEELAAIYDQRQILILDRERLYNRLETEQNNITEAGINFEEIESRINEWTKLSEETLTENITEVIDANDTENIALITGYVRTFEEWAQAVNQLTELNPQYKTSLSSLDRLNLSKNQLDLCLEAPADSTKRQELLEELKNEFPDRIEDIENVLAAYDEYSPFKGRLDDPASLKRMLQGAGILEFRILPTEGHPEVDMNVINGFIERLQEKGPDYASEVDDSYVWCEIENPEEWSALDKELRPAFTGQFGDKTYVLASNSIEETILHATGSRSWKLERAFPTTVDGRRAIGFTMDERGSTLFGNVTGSNIGRPLCIMLDGLAISAPNIDSRVEKHGTITNPNFTQTEVEDMVDKLNAGSLPARLIEQPISENTIGPSIGTENRDQGIKAGFVGLIVVIACMAIYYCFAGGIADVALLLNILFVLAIMAGIRATFTLPGIAGIILTIGMSVDANVLIFERIREEQLKGSSLRIAITNGYQKAFRTILDANLTTLITAAILYWVASEEVKGFAIVLMLGIVSSMFTALFVTRVIFDLLLSKRIIKDHLVMLRLIHNPNVNWMRSRSVFLGISAFLIIVGLVVFFTRNNEENNKYDIEFTGGTNVQINFREGVNLSRQDVVDRIREIANELDIPALGAANVYSVGDTGKQYEITTTETNKISATVIPETAGTTIDQITSAINKAQSNYATKLNDLRITQKENGFEITTSQMSRSLVQEVLRNAFPEADISELTVNEVVSNAIIAAFEDELEIQRNLQPEIISQEKITEEMIETYPALADFIGGIKIECNISRSASLAEIEERFNSLRFRPDMQDSAYYPYNIYNATMTESTDPNQIVTSFVYASASPEASIQELDEEEFERFADNENSKVLAATQFETSLPRVRQFDASVGAEQKTRAVIAIVLSLFAIVTYIWIRFGNLRYGLAAIVALVHDVCITLGAVTACTYIASSPIGKTLLIGDFKIDLAMIAAFLTLIGYSLNDTIVVFDRIRENRGKSQILYPQTITNSINQTISRTIMTSFTTFIVVLIMFIFGGQGLRGFTFAIGCGIIIGTYSSIAIAAPILLFGEKSIKEQKRSKGK